MKVTPSPRPFKRAALTATAFLTGVTGATTALALTSAPSASASPPLYNVARYPTGAVLTVTPLGMVVLRDGGGLGGLGLAAWGFGPIALGIIGAEVLGADLALSYGDCFWLWVPASHSAMEFGVGMQAGLWHCTKATS
jgi:hypothetical protein